MNGSNRIEKSQPSADWLDGLARQLREEGCSCVIRQGDEIRSFHERGVRNLYELLEHDPAFLKGASVADKVVGKGAAALMVLGGVREVYAGVISTSAVELLRRSGVRLLLGQEVPYIINRAGTGRCPVESLCLDAESPEQCFERIGTFLQTMQSK